MYTNACSDIERVFEERRSKSKVNKGIQMIARSFPFKGDNNFCRIKIYVNNARKTYISLLYIKKGTY